jgi:hypothetical protein
LGKTPGPDRLLIEVGERVEKVREKAKLVLSKADSFSKVQFCKDELKSEINNN